MPVYKYEALDSKGKKTEGVLETEDADEVFAELLEQGLHAISVLEIDERGEEFSGLMGQIGIILISFLIGATLILVKGAIREPLLKEGPAVLFGVSAGTGFIAALIATMLLLLDRIKSPGRYQFALVSGILLITVLIIGVLMVLADVLGWD